MNPGSRYAYSAVRSDGLRVSGVIDADSRDAAATALAGRGLFPLDLGPEGNGAGPLRLPRQDLADGLRMLAMLLETGLPMSRALPALEELVPASWRRALPAVADEVRRGGSLTAALSESGLGLPAATLGILRAGESGGQLDLAVRRAAETLEASASLRRGIRSALAYPALLAAVGAATLALLLGVVLPRFTVMLSDLGQELPATTRLVIGAAGAARALFLPGTAALVVALAAGYGFISRPAGRLQWEDLLLRLPAIGTIRRTAATARVAAALESLLAAGAPLAGALGLAADSAGNYAISTRILAARERVIQGTALAGALAATGAVTPLAVRLIRAGEQTGRLAEVLGHVARIEAERVERRVRSLVRMLEPTLVLLLAAIVGLVAIGLLQAVYAARPLP